MIRHMAKATIWWFIPRTQWIGRIRQWQAQTRSLGRAADIAVLSNPILRAGAAGFTPS